MPGGMMQSVGCAVIQHGRRGTRPAKAYQRWMERIPAVYREAVHEDGAFTESLWAIDPSHG